ncbi:MAG: hypothetical protein ACYTGZ_22080 [Planctomycetota bacterium]|jgi:hypothetical protein
MRRLSLVLLLAATAGAIPPAFELPRDKKATVLSIGYRGPFVHPRKNGKPSVSILADGTIQAEHVKAGTKMSAKELHELLRFVIAEHKLMKFDRKAVKAKALRGIPITDQADTIVKIAVKGRKHTVVYNASTWAAQHNPKVKELQSLEAVRKRLHSLWCVAQLGGPAEAKKLLKLANRALKKKHPKAAALTLEDLDQVDHRKNGLRRVQFAHWDAKGATGAYVNLPKKGKPTVEAFVQPR